jgi:hypothetical protein
MIKLDDLPQLRLLAWNRPENAWLDEAEAFALYESHWRFIEPATLTPAEAALIQRLTIEQGKGLLLA